MPEFMTERLLYLEMREHSAPLADELDTITKEALALWQNQHLRTFTAHGEVHILQVEANLDALTRGLQASPQKLEPYEIFVLIAACYLHDIGMQLGEPDARADHAEYAFKLILHSHAQHEHKDIEVRLSINDRNAREAIAAVARGHWTNFAIALATKEKIYGNTPGRLRLLGLLLATADLLDLSQMRATFFRSPHRLDRLDATAQLHQTMHELVKGFEIIAPDSGVSEELQYVLEWSDNSETTRMISDWALHWFHSQWRTVAPLLYRESGGKIRWVKPWVIARFRPPIGPLPKLSDEAARILRAERADQLRIDRDAFTRSFKEAIGKGEVALFRFPSDAAIDGNPVVKWCESHARLHAGMKVARCDIQPTAALDQASIVAQLIDQLGDHLPTCTNDVAIQRLQQVALVETSGIVTILVVGMSYDARLLAPIIEAAMQRPASAPARLVLLLASAAGGPASIAAASTTVSAGEPFVKADVIRHLQKHWGLNPAESEQTFATMESIGVASQPAMVYEYVKSHCGIAAARIP